MNSTPKPTRSDGWNVVRGLCMGCADVVPGVSGGTVALILGIYVRLVTAISRVDTALWSKIRSRQWAEACDYLDLRFLVTLATGIGIGIVGMSLIINRLLTDPASRSYTLAIFFGMIAASAVVLGKLIRLETWPQRWRALLIAVLAANLAWRVSMLSHHDAADPSHPWLFVCGAIGICAMILPGISGAMILLVLGVYVHLTEIPKNLLAGVDVGQSLVTLAVFGSGCAIGLVLFSKVLRWLLTTFHAATMSALTGFMIGALVKLWPFQHDTTPEVEKFKHKEFELYWPEALDGQAITVIVLAAAAAVLVFAVDAAAKRHAAPA